MENAKRIRFRAASPLLAVLAVLIFAAAAHAQTLSLLAPAIANVNGSLTARFGVTVEELPILKGELEDGVELVLNCNIELSEVMDYWVNSGIASNRFKSTLKFDPLTKEYVMTLPGRDAPLKNKSLEMLLREGWGTIEAGLGPWSRLERGQEYSLSLQTTMNEVGAPQGFTRFIYFWSWDAGFDATFVLNFTY